MNRHHRSAPTRRSSAARSDAGFTLVELLVVIIIIGILAAIAVPIFMNQRTKAAEKAVLSQLVNVRNQALVLQLEGASMTDSNTWKQAIVDAGLESALTGTVADEALHLAVCATADDFVLAGYDRRMLAPAGSLQPIVHVPGKGLPQTSEVDPAGGTLLQAICDASLPGAVLLRWNTSSAMRL